ncbi:hypothetical protein RRF57_000444 [Xylaria bambusicola]|uniref:Uncharacterized protein n=1 Tax=Xylaria bambusicola TaxID=326684 RepID=A0AAN7Z2I4_9PEZI
MSAYHGHSTLLGNQQHVIWPSELDEAEKSPCRAPLFNTAGSFISMIDGVQERVHLLPAIYGFILSDTQVRIIVGITLNLQDTEPFLRDITAYNVVATSCLIQGKLVHFAHQRHGRPVVIWRGYLTLRCLWAMSADERLSHRWIFIVVIFGRVP